MGKNDGYTYLEILIVILIIGIVTAMGHTSYLNYNARKQVEVQTSKVVQFFDLARTKTQASQAACDTYGGFYSVVLNSNYPNSVIALVPSGCPIETSYTFPTGYSFPEGSVTISYQPFGTGLNGPACVIVQHPRLEYCGVVNVTQAGAITDELLTECNC